jgi:putative PIN family toxin of toxin-antitoxin system
VSDETIAELDDVLHRPKFDKYVSETQRLEFLAALVREAELIDVVDVITDCRDPKDNKFLELALSGRASHVVTGDTDLLVLHPFREIAIVTPQSFLTMLGVQNPSAEPV